MNLSLETTVDVGARVIQWTHFSQTQSLGQSDSRPYSKPVLFWRKNNFTVSCKDVFIPQFSEFEARLPALCFQQHDTTPSVGTTTTASVRKPPEFWFPNGKHLRARLIAWQPRSPDMTLPYFSCKDINNKSCKFVENPQYKSPSR